MTSRLHLTKEKGYTLLCEWSYIGRDYRPAIHGKEVCEWCLDNLGYDIKITTHLNWSDEDPEDKTINSYSIEFQSEDDATLFKLKWL